MHARIPRLTHINTHAFSFHVSLLQFQASLVINTVAPAMTSAMMKKGKQKLTARVARPLNRSFPLIFSSSVASRPPLSSFNFPVTHFSTV